MVSELLTIIAETDGSNTAGTCTLRSQLFYSPTQVLVVPLGMKLKIWTKRMSGDVDTIFYIRYTNDITVQNPTWEVIDVEKYLANMGEVNIEKRRPIVIVGRTGKEAIQITWSQANAGKAYLELEVEFTDE